MRLKPSLPLFAWLALLPIARPLAAAEPVLLDDTESTTIQTAIDLPALPRLVATALRSADRFSRKSLRECLAEVEPPDNKPHTLFKAIALPPMPDGRTPYYVRPLLTPYCSAFYGAHVFHYWIVASRPKGPATLLHDGVVDQVVVHATVSNGRPDLQETRCTAMGCLSNVLRYDGKRYRARECKQVHKDVDGKEITESIPCSDN